MCSHVITVAAIRPIHIAIVWPWSVFRSPLQEILCVVVWLSGCVGNTELSSGANVYKPNYGAFRRQGKNCCSQCSGK